MSFDKSSNPFYDNDNHSFSKRPDRQELSDEEQIQRMMAEIEASEQRQLDSTRRALASIDDSERVGIATAEVCCLQKIAPGLWP